MSHALATITPPGEVTPPSVISRGVDGSAPASVQFQAAMEWLGANSDAGRWLVFSLFLLAGLATSWLVFHFLRRQARKEATLHPGSLVPALLKTFGLPASIFIVTYFLSMGVDTLGLPGWLWLRVDSTLFPVLYGLAALVLIFQLIDLLVIVIRNSMKNDHPHFEKKIISRVLKVLVVTFFLSMAVDSMELPGWLWERFHYTLFPIIYGVAILTLIFRFIDIAALLFKNKISNTQSHVDTNLTNLISRVLKAVTILIALVVILDNVGIKVTAMLTGLGFFGAAIALAAQHTLANVFASVNILMDKMYKVGDRIKFGEYDGFVQDMGLRSTKIRALTGEMIILPNKDISDRQIRNMTRDGASLIETTVSLTYAASRSRIEEAMGLLSGIFEKCPEVVSHSIVFKTFGAYSMDLNCYLMARYTNAGEYSRILTGLNLQIKEAFDAAGLAFAFPTQTIEVQSLPGKPSA
ncbi:MAG: mechanosensitive ion channel [Verrucomicrobiae bacterium]|nr:mechanosensitive ion channel [Verrucomicrobiae bacterium]